MAIPSGINRDRVKHYQGTNETFTQTVKTRDQRGKINKRGLTVAQYDELLKAQGGVCAICKRPESILHHGKNNQVLAVDHDHDTGAIRGLLCFGCNIGLGRLEPYLDSAKDFIANPPAHNVIH